MDQGVRRFPEKFISGTGRAKHPAKKPLNRQKVIARMLSAKHTLRERPYVSWYSLSWK